MTWTKAGDILLALIACVVLAGFVECIFQLAEQSRAKATEPDTKRYSVTLYSGGEAVEYWIVDEMPRIDGDNQVTHIQGGRIIIGGPVVIQPYKQRPPY